MRIAYFTDTFSPQINGVANTMNYLTDYLQRKNIEYLVFAPQYESPPLNEKQSSVVRCKGVRPVFYPECSLAFPNYLLLKNQIRSFRPDLIHITTEYGIGLCGLTAGKALNVPIVMSYHTNFDRYLNGYGLRHLENPYWHYMKWFHHFATLNLCPSVDTKKVLEQKGFHDLSVWDRGVDRNDFGPQYRSSKIRNDLGGGTDSVIFLYAGRISREKGLDTIAASIPSLYSKLGHKIRFVFTGDGPYKKELEAMNLPNTIFTGAKNKKELAVIYASSDVFMFPSGTETFGNVVLEAMASGLSILCVNSGGIKDFTENGNNAFVCEYGNTPNFTHAMFRLATDIKLREILQIGALRTAHKRTWDNVLKKLLNSYEALLNEKENNPNSFKEQAAG